MTITLLKNISTEFVLVGKLNIISSNIEGVEVITPSRDGVNTSNPVIQRILANILHIFCI